MLLKFLVVVLIIFIIVGIMLYIVDEIQVNYVNNQSRRLEKYINTINKIRIILIVITIILAIIFGITNIIILIYGIINKYVSFIILGVMFIIAIAFLGLTELSDVFSEVFETLLVLYMIYLLAFLTFQANVEYNVTTEVIKVNTINIIEFEKVPYTNISGTRYYIYSEPSLAYYYDIITDSGNRTTKVIDGYNNYVERCENDIYKENPHIDVFEVVEKYTNGYGIEHENVKNYEYYIYIPKDSTYFIDKE